MKLPERDYRILLVQVASQYVVGFPTVNPDGIVRRAQEVLEACGIENGAELNPTPKEP